MRSSFLSILRIGIAAVFCKAMLFANDHDNCVSKQPQQLLIGYNAPSGVELCQAFDVFASVGFLFWQPIQENMQLGVVSDNSAILDLVNGYEVPIGSSFRPGFQLGLGMNFDYDNWDSSLEYTWFISKQHTTTSVDANNPSLAIFPAWQIPAITNPQYSAATETWKLWMNLLDWDLGRASSVGKQLSLRPFFGMRLAFIKQTLNVTYTNILEEDLFIWPTTFVSSFSNSWGIGPRLGANLNWHLSENFRIISDGEWDILFTQYNLKSTQSSDTTASNLYIVNTNPMNYLRSHANLDLGLAWGSYFFNRKCHFDLEATYCFQVFFDQNMFRNAVLAQGIGKSILPNGNLYINGLTLTAKLDF